MINSVHYAPRHPSWVIDCGGETTFRVYPKIVFEAACHYCDGFEMPGKIGSSLIVSPSPSLSTMMECLGHDGASWDSAVPIGPDGKYPHGGAAITVYAHNILPCGVVPYETIKSAFRNYVVKAIEDEARVRLSGITD